MAQKAVATNRVHSLIDAFGALASNGNDPARCFAALADQWRAETAMFSSIQKKVNHPAYQKIIAMGAAGLSPFILSELKSRPAYWFPALRAITRASPYAENEKVDIRRATAAWLKWGEERGYARIMVRKYLSLSQGKRASLSWKRTEYCVTSDETPDYNCIALTRRTRTIIGGGPMISQPIGLKDWTRWKRWRRS